MTASPMPISPTDATRSAQENTLLSPRFYTTDFEELDRTDVSTVRSEWDALIAELRSDPNRKHFVRNEEFDGDFSACRLSSTRSFATSSSVRSRQNSRGACFMRR